jgi:hypothetical protein
VKVISFVITFVSLASYIYESQSHNLHVGSEDCMKPYMILGKECDLPFPPYFLVVFMASKFVMSPEPFVQKCKSLAQAKDLYVDVKDGSI